MSREKKRRKSDAIERRVRRKKGKERILLKTNPLLEKDPEEFFRQLNQSAERVVGNYFDDQEFGFIPDHFPRRRL